MATAALIIQAIIAVLKFPAELSAFIKLISKSPEEKRQEIMVQVQSWMDQSSSSDRPTWEHP
jgi:hypothetical protein